MKVTDVFVLADDVQMIPIDILAEDRRHQLQAPEGAVVVTRATDGSYVKVVDSEIATLVREFAHGATIVDAVMQYCRARLCDCEELLDAALPILEELIGANVLATAESDESSRSEATVGKTKRAAVNRFSQPERLLADYARRLNPDGEVFEGGLPEPPHTSINYGSGGIAYFFYRLACIREDAQFLSWAKLWIEKAIQEVEDKGESAFFDVEGELPPEIIGRVALYHSPTGLHAVKALIGHAANDYASQADGVAGFVKAAQTPCDNIDVTLGTAGLLLGAALLDEAMPGQPEVRSLGTQLLAGIWGQLDAMPHLAEERRFRSTGIAHGWAGVLYAVLSWCRITGTQLPATMPERLYQLADVAEPLGDGTRWGQEIRSASGRTPPDFSASWCNGTAGMIHLWTRAHETFQDTRFLKLAEGAARNVAATPEPVAQLCCGRPGQAYALLNLYKHTGERRWLDDAHKFAEQSCRLSPVPADTEAPPLHYALYKGPLGTALLSADLDEPSEACMPMFESESWKASSRPRVF
jgi:serine/threonine-protein kinase